MLYVGDDAMLQEIAARLDMDPVSPENPYWAEHGLTFADPDGSASYWSLKFGDDRRRCGFVAKDDFRPTQRGL